MKSWLMSIMALVFVLVCGASVVQAEDGVIDPNKQMTLRLLIWDGYAPKEVRDSFIKSVREKYGVDLAFSITYASNPDDFFDALRNDKVDLISPAWRTSPITGISYQNSTGSPGPWKGMTFTPFPWCKDLTPWLTTPPWCRRNPLAGGSFGILRIGDDLWSTRIITK